jgi:hypothetical protein
MSTDVNRFPPQSSVKQFSSVRAACLSVLRNAKSSCGRSIPLTAAEIHQQLESQGLRVRQQDIEALLRELSQDGSVQEVDVDAGFRWIGAAA